MAQYVVRTLIRVEADDPLEAARLYKRFIYESDLNALVYRVEDAETEHMTYVYRHHAMSLDELTEHLANLDAPDEPDEPTNEGD